jgi:hypothetical protein
VNHRGRSMTRICGVLSSAIGFALFSATVTADDDAIERCRLQQDPAARIACLEAALGGGDAGSRTTAESPPATPEESPPTPPAENARATAEESPPAQRPPAVPKAAPAPPAAATSIGAEQIKTRAEAEAELAYVSNLEVERYDHFPHMRLEVYLKNGQVWRQINGDTQEVRADLRKNQTVDIEESSLGGYKMRLNEMRRTIRVRRVR